MPVLTPAAQSGIFSWHSGSVTPWPRLGQIGILAFFWGVSATAGSAEPTNPSAPQINGGVDAASNGPTADATIDTSGLKIAPAPIQPIDPGDALVFCRYVLTNYYDLYRGKNSGLARLITVVAPELLRQIDAQNRTLPRTTVRQAKINGIVPGSWRTVAGKPGIAVFQVNGLLATAGDNGVSGQASIQPVRWTIILARVNPLDPNQPEEIGLSWVETPQGRKGFPNNLCGLLLLKAELSPK